jgi:hypothetical protein
MSGEIEIRSYRVVFELERRLHRVDRFRIPLPYGLPLRTIAYALAALVLVLVVVRLPVAGTVLRELPAPARFLALPGVAAFALTQVRVDGRTAHAAGLCLMRYATAPRRIASWRATPRANIARLGDIRVAPDAGSARVRPGVVDGPAEVLVRHGFRACPRGRTLTLHVDDAEPAYTGKRVVLEADQRLVIRCAHR